MATRHIHGNQVSPWFGCMEASGLLYKWWDAVLERRLDTVLQRDVIHRQHDLEALAQGKQPGAVGLSKVFKATLAATQAAGTTGPRVVNIPCEPVHPNWRAAAGSQVNSSKAASSGRRGASPAARGVSSTTGSAGASTAVASKATQNNSNSSSSTMSSRVALTAAVPDGSGKQDAAIKKQGAYGKVTIHKDSLFTQLSHMDEVFTAVGYKLGLVQPVKVAALAADASADLVFCEAMLCRVSRSFAMVIQQLPPHLRTSICVFYLVLRGLDTVSNGDAAWARCFVVVVMICACATGLEDARPGLGHQRAGTNTATNVLTSLPQSVCSHHPFHPFVVVCLNAGGGRHGDLQGQEFREAEAPERIPLVSFHPRLDHERRGRGRREAPAGALPPRQRRLRCAEPGALVIGRYTRVRRSSSGHRCCCSAVIIRASCSSGPASRHHPSLLTAFTTITVLFILLLQVNREVIADICKRMGEGMADFSGRDLREGTIDRKDYNLYCHYVAGLVGEGLSKLFVAHGDEDAIVGQDMKLADDMGLFLQKTNIIRDYLEDLVGSVAVW